MKTQEDLMDWLGFKKRPIRKVYLLVNESVTTFEQDSNATEAYEHTENFDTENLTDDEHNALMYYWKRVSNPPKSYFLPIANPQDFVMGQNAAWTIYITIGIEYVDGSEDEVPYVGYFSDEECEEGQELLKELIEQGY